MHPDRRRKLAGLLFLLAGALALFFLLRTPRPDLGVRYLPANFADLPGWAEDDHGAALDALRRSCVRRLALPAERPVEPEALAGRVADWRELCTEALEPAASASPRAWFERHFTPLAVEERGSPRGLFTGYFEPLIHAATEPSERYRFPVYRRPPELVTVDLGRFREELAGRSIAGRVEDGRLVPFASRAEIVAGALAGRNLELLWADDPVAVFFLQIQGSGRALLPDGRMVRLGYDGPNGHPYSSLGKLMVARGLIAADEVSAPAIAAFLRDHPGEAAGLMAENASFVFFRLIEGEGPLGAEGTVLTPGRSLAVDRARIPIGAPLWLATGAPDPDRPESESHPLQRLMISQDSGAAITGAVRGDVFFGFGKAAESMAGHMAHHGRWWLLLPKDLAARVSERGAGS